MAWGENSSWQLGDGTDTNSSRPRDCAGLEWRPAVAAGSDFGLALLENGMVMSWGTNDSGALGDGKTETEQPYSAAPVPVSGLSGVTAIAARGAHALALLNNGTVMAWGSQRLRAGSAMTRRENRDAPVPVSGLAGVKALAAGFRLQPRPAARTER